MPNQLRRAKNLAQSTFRSPSPEAAAPTGGASVPVAPIASIEPGTMQSFDVAGEHVAVANTAAGLFAFNDTCTHRKCSLSEGELDGTTLTCICHGSQFDITTGAVRRGPADRPVKVYVVRQDGDQIVVDA